MNIQRLRTDFVDLIPENLLPGTIYVCISYATVVHLCCCGCGSEVVTPLTPTDWSLTYDGETVSLHPSVGNWGFECRSHYWIRRGRVSWAEPWSQDQIARGRDRDQLARASREISETTRQDRSRTPRPKWVPSWLATLWRRITS